MQKYIPNHIIEHIEIYKSQIISIIMKNIKRELVCLGLTGIIAVSGCSLLPPTTGGIEPKDLRKLAYAEELRLKADELSNSKNIEDLTDATVAYGNICELEKMDECIKKIINIDLGRGLTYSEIGKRFHDFYKK
jgi:hypothetical protein